jgi:hypothetical protein
MSDSNLDPVSSAVEEPVRLPKATSKSANPKKWFWVISVTIIAVLVAAQILTVWQIYKLRKDVAGLKWSDAIRDRDDDSAITTDVDSIQFMRKGGYSISFDTAKYTGEGLYLHGVVGNPTGLTVSNLSLKFTVTKQLYQYQDEFDKDPYVMLIGPPPIGEAQCSPLSFLLPGTTEPFEVTIPNVRQTKEGVRLVVVFQGERYSY